LFSAVDYALNHLKSLGFKEIIMFARIASAAILSVAFMAGAAQAEDIALAKNSMRLFGGPSMDYPRIGLITWGQGLKVLGCDDRDWCEVVADGQRGWVPAAKMTWPATPENRMQANRPLERVTL
jgi:uncharacterized protein YraI